MTTPIAAYRTAQKAASTAQQAERDALWNLPEKELKSALRVAHARVLRGTKDVEVDFEIDAADLEHLGYHKTEECGGETDGDEKTPYQELAEETLEARQALSDWHDTTHGITLWAGCRQEPCNTLNHFFRSTP